MTYLVILLAIGVITLSLSVDELEKKEYFMFLKQMMLMILDL